MSISNRLIAMAFSALPGFFFLALFFAASLFGMDYWWGTYLTVLIALVIGGLYFGFALPNILQGSRLNQPWMWITASGLIAWALAFLLLGILNLTPLCVGQDNGDGRNDISLCVISTVASGIVYAPVYLVMLGGSAFIGDWFMRASKNGRGAPWDG
jgi:hypothetical protein